MDNNLRLFVPFSLKELLLRKVAVLFCSNSDVLKFFNKSYYSQLPFCAIKEWLEATEEKILKLGLPKSLNKQVIDRIEDIGFQITMWKEMSICGSEVEIELPDVSTLSWTSTGAIDYRKIAELYVLCDRLALDRRFQIACRNCLENHIPLLWTELSVEAKMIYDIGCRPMHERCWPYILNGEQSKLDDLWRESGRNLTSFDQWAFEESAEWGNRVAVEYFFQKLTPEERELSIMRTMEGVFFDGVFFYLLSVMTPEQQMEMVKARPVEVLLCFLDWPRRHLLPVNAGLIWAHLPQSDYGHLLNRMFCEFKYIKNFSKLFQEFLKHAPLDFIRKSFVGHESAFSPPACSVLCELIDCEDWESVEVMFRHADEASRVKLMLCDEVFLSFYDCISREKWHGVEVCLREAALSEEDRDALKKSYMRFLNQRLEAPVLEQKFRRFFELIDASDGKEKKAKRLKLE